jgi:hypothetical protein
LRLRLIRQPGDAFGLFQVEKKLTGRETAPHEIIYFEVYKSQIPVIDKAIDKQLP